MYRFCRNSGVGPKRVARLVWRSSCKALELVGCRHGFAGGAVHLPLADHVLSDEAKAQLMSLQFCDQELQRLQARAAAYQTDPMAYAKALQSALPVGDTIKFN